MDIQALLILLLFAFAPGATVGYGIRARISNAKGS
jgi:hypothetical protein